PTTCWMQRAPPRRPGSGPARTRLRARPRWFPSSARSEPGPRPPCWPRRPPAISTVSAPARTACATSPPTSSSVGAELLAFPVSSGPKANGMSAVRTPLLDRVLVPSDLRNLSAEQLRVVADELRAETIDAVSVTGGHLGSALGVVELTVALHAVFDTPHDRLIWDVGHQAYPHKILTGRRDRIRTLRQGGGLSGFTRRAESVYDPFGAAHSSTSISAGLGMAIG